MKRKFILFCALLCTLLLIWRPEIAASGASDGIELCIRTAIPSLLPFIFLTTVICSYSDLLHIPFLRNICRRIGVPAGCETVVLLGLIGGYPIGARCIYDTYKDGKLPRGIAQRMLGFCNNAGPSFIFGVLSATFSNTYLLWLLWLTQIVSAILTGFLLKIDTPTKTASMTTKRISITSALISSVRTMASICGWIVLFRIVYRYLDHWFLSQSSPVIRTIITGILELTNGCLFLNTIPNEGIRYIVCCTMLCFGGICVSLQTKSVVGDLGLGQYFPGKLLQTIICLALSAVTVYIFF